MSEDLLFVDYVNSDWWDGRGHSKDRLRQPGWLAAFVGRWLAGGERAEARDEGDERFGPRRVADPGPASEPDLTDEEWALLFELRGILREVIDAIATGRPVPERLVARLGEFLDVGRVRHRLSRTDDGYSIDPIVEAGDAAGIASAVALSAAEFLAHGEPGRLKQCANDGCRWVFHDTTKNASRRWCDSRACGNADKVRRYRDRQRQQARA